MRRICNLIVLLSFALLIVQCSNDTPEKEREMRLQKDKLSGQWEVVKAVRDDKPTKLLNKTKFNFTKDSMMTNLPTQEGRAAYSWAKNDIIRQSDDITTYTVHTLNNDSLEFSVDLQGFKFDMTLKKIQEDSIN